MYIGKCPVVYEYRKANCVMIVIARIAVLFFVLSILSACHPLRQGEARASGVRAVTPEYIELENGQKLALPFAGQEGAQWVFLVRHAEKAYGSDPPLAAKGEKRARLLADIFGDFPLDALYSTHYKRTLATAQPIARRKGLEVRPYQADQLTTFALELRRQCRGQAVLVVGHSNTTPELVSRLAARADVERIDERDYSNLFLVAISGKGEREVVHLYFGDLWEE